MFIVIEGLHLAYSLSKTIVLVGLMGSGKTAVGNLIAQKLGAAFIDSDQEIEKAANMSIAEIFERDGEAFFRVKEAQIIARLLRSEPSILSTGGGAYMSEKNRDEISKCGVALWLRADLDLLWERVRHKDTRPLLQVENPLEVLKSLYEARSPQYAKAEIVVDAETDLTLDEMANKVVEALLRSPQSGVQERQE